MSAKILKFISRKEQVRQRGMHNYCHWKRVTKGLEPFGPAERRRLFLRQAEDEVKDRSWVQRHHPLAEGGVVLSFRRSFTAGRPLGAVECCNDRRVEQNEIRSSRPSPNTLIVSSESTLQHEGPTARDPRHIRSSVMGGG